jgi:hypothetical protein
LADYIDELGHILIHMGTKQGMDGDNCIKMNEEGNNAS